MPITDNYNNHGNNVQSQPRGSFSVTPSDYIDMQQSAKALYIGTSGDVSVVTSNGTVQLFKNVPIGVLPVQVKRVNSTGTTAGNIVALIDDYTFEVTDIAGVNLWFDASDKSTLTLDANGIVQQWNNKISGGPNLVKSANDGPKYLPEAPMTSGLPTLFWDNTLQKKGLEFSASEVAVNNIFMVMQYKDGLATTFESVNTIITNLASKTGTPTTSNERMVGGIGTGSLSASFSQTNLSENGAPVSGAVLPMPLCVARLQLTNFQLHNIMGENSGSSRNWQGYLCELIAFNSSTTLTTEQIMKIVERLKRKWKL